MGVLKPSTLSVVLRDIEILFCSDSSCNEKFEKNAYKIFFESFQMEISGFKSYLIESIDSSVTLGRFTMLQMLIISNKVYWTLLRKSKKKSFHLDAQVRDVYIKTLYAIEEIIDYCEPFSKEMVSLLPISDFKLSTLKVNYNSSLYELKTKFAISDIDHEVSEVVIYELKKLLIRKEITKIEYSYATGLIACILKTEILDTSKIDNLLIQYEFNSNLFYDYFVKKHDSIINPDSSLHQHLDFFISMEEKLNTIRNYSNVYLFPNQKSILEMLKSFYKDKREAAIQRLEVRRAEVLDGKLWKDDEKLQINMPVAQLGLFIRLLIKHKILPVENVGKTFEFFARHFKTPNANFISTQSLQKKSTTVEFETAKRIKGRLIEMINSVNKDFHVSNYSE